MRTHWIGIGGIGMSCAAMLAKDMGYQVTGSVDHQSDRVKTLETYGITVDVGHKAKNVRNPDVVIYTNAVAETNPELLEAKRNGIPMIGRLDFLSRLIAQSDRQLIGISGTDGKTTTTAMLAHILIHQGVDPSVLLGGIHEELPHGNYRKGKGPVVMEVCESDGELVLMRAHIGAVTNIRMDHLEHYHQMFEAYRQAILTYLNRSRHRVSSETIISQIDQSNHNHVYDGSHMIDLDGVLKIPGQYNRLNGACAITCAHVMGIPVNHALNHLEVFRNVDRRFSIRYESPSLVVIDDYAHTPDEIESVVQACRETYPEHAMVLAFEPHRYSRLERDALRFEEMLGRIDAEMSFLIPVYSAYERQKPHLYLDFHESLKKRSIDYCLCEEPQAIMDYLSNRESAQPVALLFVGAGNSSQWSKDLVARIMRHTKKEVI